MDTPPSSPPPAPPPPRFPLVDLHRQYLAFKPEIDAAIADVIARADFIKGQDVSRFEAALSAYLGSGHQVIACASGTDALQIALMALGVGADDEIVTTPFTFVATVETAVLLGARPVFVDIDPRTYNLDPERLAAAITPRTRAIVPVHLFGQPAEMDPICAVAQANGIPVIEDTAQALGATYAGRRAGGMAALSCFSFFPAKNLGAMGDGGAVAAAHPALAARCRLIANHGASKRYHHEILGVNSRLDTLQAAILLVKLRHLDRLNAARQRIAARYDAVFRSLPCRTPYVLPRATHVYQQYCLRVPQRARLTATLDGHGIPWAIHYPVPLHRQPAFSGLMSPADSFPVAEAVAREIIALPMFPEMTDDEVDLVIAAVTAALA